MAKKSYNVPAQITEEDRQKGRAFPILSYDQHNEFIQKLGKHIGTMTNPEMRKFGKKVVYPPNNYVRDDYGQDKQRARDEQLRQIFEREERQA